MAYPIAVFTAPGAGLPLVEHADVAITALAARWTPVKGEHRFEQQGTS